MPRRIMITVDVEAQPARSQVDPLERLVWGRFPDGDFGIGRIMDIADSRGIQLTMFLDYAEEHMYGEALLDAAREIRRRGHDLQLHLHPDFLPSVFFEERGLDRVKTLNAMSTAQADALADFLCEAHERATGERPLAFRGGGYRFCGELFRALADRGVRLDSSYNPSRTTQPMNIGATKQFVWDSGVYEIPISNVWDFGGTNRFVDYNFNAGTFLHPPIDEAVGRHLDYLDQFHDQHGDDAIAVLVMHSWSFLALDDEGCFSRTLPDAPLRLDLLLEELAARGELITASRALDLMESGDAATAGEVAFAADPELQPAEPPAVEPAAAAAPARSKRATKARARSKRAAKAAAPSERIAGPSPPSDPACSICGAPRSAFRDADTKGRHCACGSLERQRVFADLKSKGHFDLLGARVLAIAPSVVELALFEDYGVTEVMTVDIRPEAKPDLIADVCDMPQVPDESYDVVFASYVLTCVHDLDRALAEFARVLRPGGRLLATDPIAFGEPTREFTDPARITSWYGQEAFEKYRVGSFRLLGANDVRDSIGKHFDVEQLAGVDAPTGTVAVWHIGTKAGESSPRESSAAAGVSSSAGSFPAPLVPAIERRLAKRFGAPARIVQATHRDDLISFRADRTFWKLEVEYPPDSGRPTRLSVLAKCSRKLSGRHRALDRYLSRRGLPVPDYYGMVRGGGERAALWEFQEGRSDATFDTYSEDELKSLVAAVARIGATTTDVGERLPLPRGISWGEPMAERLRAIVADHATLAKFEPQIEAFGAVEQAAIDRLNALGPPVLNHNDLKAGNVILGPNGACIVDWDGATIGPPGATLRKFAGTKVEQTVASLYRDYMVEYGIRLELEDVLLAMRGQQVFWAFALGVRGRRQYIPRGLRLVPTAFPEAATA